MSYKNEVLASAPSHYWRLDEAHGVASVADSAGSVAMDLGGTFFLGEPSLLPAGEGSALRFDGSTGYAQPAMLELPASARGLSYELWVEASWRTDTYDTLIIWDDGASRFRLYDYSGDELTWSVGSAAVVAPAAAPTGQAHHIVATYDAEAGVMRLFVNGELKGERTDAPAWPGLPTVAPRVARAPDHYTGGSAPIDATFDEVAIYPRALTPEEIRRHYWAGQGKSGYELEVLVSNPAHWYRMAEQTGASLADDVGGLSLPLAKAVAPHEHGATEGRSLEVQTLGGGEANLISGGWAGITVEAWLYVPIPLHPDTKDQPLLGYSQNNESVTLRLRNGTAQVVLDTSSDSEPAVDLPLGAWTSVVLAGNGSEVDVYIDGRIVTTLPGDVVPSKLVLAKRPWNGSLIEQAILLDEMVVYPRALTPAEVRRHYLVGKAEHKGYALEVLASDPLAWWRLDEDDGTAAKDERGNHSGELVGSYTLGAESGPHIGNRGIRLHGDNSRSGVLVADHNDLTPDQAFGVEVWMICQPGSGGRLIGKERSGSTYPEWLLHLSASSGVVNWRVHTANSNTARTELNSETVVNDGELHHIVGTYGDGYLRLYVDGVEEGRTAFSGIPHNSSAPLGIGVMDSSMNAWSTFEGVIDEPAIYRRLLTPDEIARHYAVGSYGLAAVLRYLAGKITLDGAPAEVLVRALRWDTAELLGEATSDPADGSYRIEGIEYDGECLVVTQPPAGFRPLAHGPILPVEQSEEQ